MLIWWQMLWWQWLMLHAHVIQMGWRRRRWWSMICQMGRCRCKWLTQCEIRTIYANRCKRVNRIQLENTFFFLSIEHNRTWWLQYCWLVILWFQRNLIFILFIATTSDGIIFIVRWNGFYNFNCIISDVDLQIKLEKKKSGKPNNIDHRFIFPLMNCGLI